jgi:hypothetical protein
MRIRAVFALSVSSFWLALVRPALACSVCECDPVASSLAVDRPAATSLRVSVESRLLRKESGAGEDAESERENQAMLRLQYSPLDRLTLQAEVPGFLWKRHLDAQGVQDDNATGLGDVAFFARYEVLRLGYVVPRHLLAVSAGLKLPTGANDRHLPGAEPDEHIQLGTGTYDKTVGLTYLFGDLPWTLFADVSARLNGTNSRGFRYGNALYGSLGARRAFLDSQRLTLALEAQVRSAGKDRIGGGASYDENSGGQVYYGTASAAFAITDKLLVRGTVQVPVATSLNGTQSEHTVGYLQFAYDFTL